MSARITVVAILKAKAGQETEVHQELMHMVAETHKEPGCINYDLHRSVDDPAVFLFYENWESKDALDKHMQTQHFLNLQKKASGMLACEPEIKLYEMVSTPGPVRV